MQKGILIIISLICSAFGIIGCQPTSDNTTDVFPSNSEQTGTSSEIHESFDESISNDVSADDSESETEQSAISSEFEGSEESKENSSYEDESDSVFNSSDGENGGGIVLPEIPFE